jgi:hypothetical protein
MRIFSFFVMTLFSFSLLAADFQLAELSLGAKKADIKAETLATTHLTLFEAEAKVEMVWTEDQLTAVLLNFYQGSDYPQLKQKFSALQQQLTANFGAVSWISPDTEPTESISPEQQLHLLEQVMKNAAETAATYKKSHLANSTLVLDFQPTPQPDNSRLHLQLSYSSISGEYSLILFVDEKTAAARTATAIVNLEAF